MDSIAKSKSSDREELFISTAYEMRLPEAMAEKDFWACTKFRRNHKNFRENGNRNKYA